MIKKRLRENDTFVTQELSLIGALLAWNFPLTTVDKTDPKKVIFVFPNSPELQKAIQTFWNDTGVVTPKKYFNALREAKSRIYGGQT